MKAKTIILSSVALLSAMFSQNAAGQTGKPFIHDPSTIMECDGKY